MSEPAHLFVYGTLRAESSHPMARRLRTQARLVGKGSVPGRLYDLGWYPAGVFDANEKRRIRGDVFALPPGGKLLAEMDAYEGTDPEYARLPLDVTLDDGRDLCRARGAERQADSQRRFHRAPEHEDAAARSSLNRRRARLCGGPWAGKRAALSWNDHGTSNERGGRS